MWKKRFTVHWHLSSCMENFCGYAFDKNENKFLHNIYLVFTITVIKLLGKSFMVCRKSMKSAQVLSHIAFIIYAIMNYLIILYIKVGIAN